MYISETYINETSMKGLIPKVNYGNTFEQTLVIIVHGFNSGAEDMFILEDRISKAGYSTYVLNLPTTFGSLNHLMATASKQLRAIEFGNTFDKVYFVSHSMGGILSRLFIGQYNLSKVEKLVTLGSPWDGSPLSDPMKDTVFGKLSYSVKQGDEILQRSINTKIPSSIEVAIIAGNKNYTEKDVSSANLEFRNKAMGNIPSDGTVPVQSALKYPGRAIKKVFPNNHMDLVRNKRVGQSVINFLTNSTF